MRRPRLRTVLIGLGVLVWLVAGIGLWSGWPDKTVSAVMIGAGFLLYGPGIVSAWRERRSKPPEPAERVLRHYPSWW
ncbi:hypothetical protein QQG74_30080 [Micromonospora sp. FIMYZ51]|uniref:hypothetical protein n=1 Tax=Micromonospora sp. FIMYZ51 TaxID=3051832 RepID=UPI00311ECE45